MASAFNVSGLSAYVAENKDLLIKHLIFGTRVKNNTIPHCAKQLGVKTKERINYFSIDPVLANGRGCGFTPSGSTTLQDRDIETAIFKVNMEWCPDDLLNKVYENEVAIAAGEERLPFEQEITEGLIDEISKKVDKLVWQGATSAYSGTDLIDGFLTKALNSDSASTISVSIASGTSVYNAVLAVYKAMPEDLLEDGVIFISPALYRQYILELVSANLYHYDPKQGDPEEMFIPGGQNVKVRKTSGLVGDKKHIYASSFKNMIYATDALNDAEEIKMWFSEDADLFRCKVRFNAGVATAYPDMVVLGTAAADLV